MSIRTGLHRDFANIARSNLESMEALFPEYSAAKTLVDKSPDDATADQVSTYDLLYDSVRSHAQITIVFAAMAVESFIFDYAAKNLSDSWVAHYLDRLDTKAKWVVIPRLITGEELPTGGHGLNLLGELIRARNALVHYKSRNIGALMTQSMEEAGTDDRVYISDESDIFGVAWQDGDRIYCMGPKASELFWSKLEKIDIDYCVQARMAVQALDVLAHELARIDPRSFVLPAFACKAK